MKRNPRNHRSFAIAFFAFLLVVITPIFSYGKQNDTPQSSDATGSISGAVVCPSGDLIDGRVMLLEDGIYFMEDWNLGTGGEFTFDEIPAGNYELLFYDGGEIPLGDYYEVEVESGRNTEVIITVPFTVSGMPCEEKLEMGINGYYEFVYSLLDDTRYTYTFLSERGMDWVAIEYGDCKAEENDQLIEDALPEYERDMILELRDALEDFECGYYSIHFFMGTGAVHFGIRTLPWREEFIGSVIKSVENPGSVSVDDINGAIKILDRLESTVDSAGEQYWDDESEVFYYETMDDFFDAAMNLREISLELPDDILVMVAEFVSSYED